MLDDYSEHIASGHVFVLEHDKAIQGYIALIPHEKGYMHLDNIATHPGCPKPAMAGSLLIFSENTRWKRAFPAYVFAPMKPCGKIIRILVSWKAIVLSKKCTDEFF